MVERFTLVQMKELLDIYTIIKILTDRIVNLESKITNMPEVIKYLIGKLKALEESIEFQNETYKKMKKHMTEEKQKLKTHSRNNKEVKNFIQQNTEMKEQITELQHRHRINNLRFMGIKENSEVETETWEKSVTKAKVFLHK